MQAMLPALFPAPSSSSGVRLVASDGREAAFQGATLHVRAQGGLAVVVLTQRFRNDHAEPLSVRYTMPLPANAAVRGYSFLLGGKLIRGEVDRKQQARERFEQAIASGQTAGLVDQERSSVFTQELGNIPPGEEIVALLELDQRLEWLDDGRWSWRFPTVVAPRYLGAAGRTPDPEKVTVDLREQPLPTPPRVELILHLLDPLQGPVDSPTHPLTTHPAEATEVRLAQHALLDRDIAVRWPVALPRVGLSLQLARPEATHPAAASSFGLLSVLPPTPSSRLRPLPRDLIFLLDASGSMYGDPIQKSKRLMRALIETLEGDDQLELICFGDMPHRWKRGPVKATREAKKEALAWVDRLQAEGGTEMKSGILEALAPLRPGAQRQVVLITDGLIGFESEIVATIHDRLPPDCRVHTVGVGSSINRSLTGPVARTSAPSTSRSSRSASTSRSPPASPPGSRSPSSAPSPRGPTTGKKMSVRKLPTAWAQCSLACARPPAPAWSRRNSRGAVRRACRALRRSGSRCPRAPRTRPRAGWSPSPCDPTRPGAWGAGGRCWCCCCSWCWRWCTGSSCGPEPRQWLTTTSTCLQSSEGTPTPSGAGRRGSSSPCG